MLEENIIIPNERYQQLIRAEHDANHLKTLIAEKYEDYGVISREVLGLLYTMYCGRKECKDAETL